MNDWPITIVEDVNLLEICLTWLTLSWFLFMFFRNLEFSPNIMDFSFRQIQKLNLSQILAQIKKRLMILIRLLRIFCYLVRLQVILHHGDPIMTLDTATRHNAVIWNLSQFHRIYVSLLPASPWDLAWDNWFTSMQCYQAPLIFEPWNQS